MCEFNKHKPTKMEEFDESIISGKPWAEKLLEASVNITKKSVLNWCNIILKIGENVIDLDQYTSIFLHHLQTLCEDMVSDVDGIQEKKLDHIAQLLEKMQHLCRDLHIDIPTIDYEHLPLCEIEELVSQKVDEYESLAEIRRKELRELTHKQLRLCKNLGRQPKLLAESPLPFPKEVEELRLHIEALENETIEREEKFFQLKEEIIEAVNELGAAPNLDFEREILDMTNSEVKITDGEMEQLQFYRDRLVKQHLSVREEIAELRHKIDDLWDKLETDIAERDVFRAKSSGNSVNTLQTLKNEVNRLEAMKKANIKGFISKQREELAQWWSKCCCTEAERKAFSYYHSECYNEDLFDLHERELQKWESHYKENQEIFALLENYKKIWNEHLELELNAGGANRYKNRGGQLLLEERLRNKLQKQIPRIEEKLLKLVTYHLQRKNKEFRIFGVTVEDYIHKLHEDKDKEFKLKLSAKKQQREQILTTGTSRANLFAPSNSIKPGSTPRPISKRKIPQISVTEPTKKMKTGNSSKRVSRSGMPKLNVSWNRRRSARREKLRQKLSFRSSRDSNKENLDTSRSTSYDEFENEVRIKHGCRSTAHGSLLEPLNIPAATPTKDVNFLVPGFPPVAKTPRRNKGHNK